MTAMAEHVLEQIKTLPAADLREVWQCLSASLNAAGPSQPGEQGEALAAAHSLYGRFAGGNSLVRLLQERARDRAREEAKVRRLARPHG